MSMQRRSYTSTQTETKTLKQENGESEDYSKKLNEEIEIIKNDNYDLYPHEYLWKIIISQLLLHVGALYGLYLVFIMSAKWQTLLWAFVLDNYTMLGVIAGAHRLWSHRSYKVKLPLKIFLLIGYTMGLQYNVTHWARDHRVHHKFSDTVADPHNSKKGFFFCHIGWLFVKRHPECMKQLRKVDLTDLYNDPLVMFHKKYYWTTAVICCFVIPTIIPMYFWEESFANAFFIAANLRVTLCHHQTFTINSFAHKWGMKPYDKNICPTQNRFVDIAAAGDGFHNFHHTFPMHYSNSEFGFKYNLAAAFVDLMAWFGLAYDRKVVPKSVIRARQLRTGDNSYNINQ